MSESAGEWQTVWYIIGEWKWQFDWMRWECHNVHILHCSLTLSAINALRFLCANFSVPHSPRACNTHDRKKAAIQLRHFDDMFYIIIDTHQNIAWRVNKELIPDQITSFYIDMLRIRHKLVTNSAGFFPAAASNCIEISTLNFHRQIYLWSLWLVRAICTVPSAFYTLGFYISLCTCMHDDCTYFRFITSFPLYWNWSRIYEMR